MPKFCSTGFGPDPLNHKTTIINSLKYCQEQKGLEIYAYVLMPSHDSLISFETKLLDTLSSGANSVNADLTDVFSIVVQKRCKEIVLIHNHPSGAIHPSSEDQRFTKEMLAASKIIKIEILDRLIITEEGYYSFLDENIIPSQS